MRYSNFYTIYYNKNIQRIIRWNMLIYKLIARIYIKPMLID